MEISTNIVLVATDYVTKWVEAKATMKNDKHVVTNVLKICFLHLVAKKNWSIMIDGHMLLIM